MVVGLVVLQHLILIDVKYRKMIKTVKMKKLMMNLMKSFHTLNQVLENEQGIYSSMDVTACDVSNNPDAENPNESSSVQYHLAPSPQFLNMENFGNVISSECTPWVKHTTDTQVENL